MQDVAPLRTWFVPDTEAPSTPTEFAVDATTSETVALSWTGSTDNVAVVSVAVTGDAHQGLAK